MSADNVKDGWKPVDSEWAPVHRAICAMLLQAFAATLPVELEEAVVDSLPTVQNVEEVQAWAVTQHPMRGSSQWRLWSGGTTLRFRVDASGSVDPAAVRVLWSSRQQFTAVALELVSRMRFRPATVHGEPVAVWITYPLTFDIQCDRSLGVWPVERALPNNIRRPRTCNF